MTKCVCGRSRSRGVEIALFAFAASLLALPAAWLSWTHAADRAAAPDPDRELRQTIAHYVSQLADPRQDARDDARHQLLSLRRRDLAILRSVVQHRLPLSPAELEPLRDIVMHVYLSEESYVAAENSSGFVGVVFDLDQHESEFETGGVEIRRRLPGFCGYRSLEDGDIVLAIGMKAHSLVEVRSRDEVISAVGQYAPGQTVLFRVCRRGRLLTVPLVLDSKPEQLSSRVTELLIAFQAERAAQAEAYWDSSFEPLIEPTAAQISP